MTPNQLKATIDSARHQTVRYLLLMTLNTARPAPAQAYMLRSVVAAVFPDVTDLEVLRELDYLKSRDLISSQTTPMGQTFAKIERYGIDVIERSVECDPGITLPPIDG